jgi:ParB-like chromosome segregation protein Spo0J
MRKNRNRNRKAGKHLSAKPKLMSSANAAGPEATPDPVSDGGTDNFTTQQSGADAATPVEAVQAAATPQADNVIPEAFAEPSTSTDDALQETQTEADPAGPEMQVHPLAKIFPLPSEDDLRSLAEDIKQNGLLEPITTFQGVILDGRCRYLACGRAGVEPKFENYVGDDPLGYVISRNLHRRHLSESQRAIVAARIADLKIGANQRTAGTPIGAAAKALNVSARSVTRAKEVVRRGVPELAKAVEGGEVSVSAAAEISRLSETEQRELVRPEGEGETASKRPGAKRRYASRRNRTARAKGDKTATAAEMARLKVELADKLERLRKAEEERATHEAAPEAVIDAPPEHAQQRFPDERDVEMERLRTDLATTSEALRNATDELASAHGEMPPLPPFLKSLDPVQQAMVEDLVGTFRREVMPKLTNTPTVVREKFLDEVGRLVRGL